MIPLTSQAVNEMFNRYTTGAFDDRPPLVGDFMGAEISFRPELEEQRPQLTAWIMQLPNQFLAAPLGGDGWSFLNLCTLEGGRQWTGLHQACAQLTAMAWALGMASYPVPREMWQVLPGGVPYVRFAP